MIDERTLAFIFLMDYGNHGRIKVWEAARFVEDDVELLKRFIIKEVNMACIAKRRNRYVIDFYDNHGKRRWKTLPKGTTKKKAREAMRDIEDELVSYSGVH